MSKQRSGLREKIVLLLCGIESYQTCQQIGIARLAEVYGITEGEVLGVRSRPFCLIKDSRVSWASRVGNQGGLRGFL